MKGFYITIKNDLLEPKHVEAMGEAVWLYMWLIDKMTSVNENGIGKVLGNSVITFAVIQHDLGISERTYNRWISRLREFGYINTIRQKYGLIITVTKAKKSFKKEPSSAAKNGGSKKPRSAKNGKTAPPETAELPDKNGGSLIRKTISTVDNISIDNNNNIGAAAPKRDDRITTLYYEAIKSLGLPVTNHRTLRKKIAHMKVEATEAEIITYLEFMRDKFISLRRALDGLDYKPDITEALDIYTKRLKIEEAFRRLAREQQTTRVWRPKSA